MGWVCRAVVWHPLGNMERFILRMSVLPDIHTDIIKTFERPHGSRPDCRTSSIVCQQTLDSLPADADPFGVHLVTRYFFAFDRLERTSPHMQGYFVLLYSPLAESLQHSRSEVQAGSRRGHGTFHLGIYGLVVRQVRCFRLSVQIGRNGKLANGFEHVGEGSLFTVPTEADGMRCPHRAEKFGGQPDGAAAHLHCAFKQAGFPAFQVSDETEPYRRVACLEH